MTLPTTDAAALLADRVLAYTDATARLADLTIDVTNLHTSLTTPLTKRDENLSDQLDALRADAVAAWRKHTPGIDAGNYEHARAAACARARAIERRARAAAEDAARLADLLDTLTHYDTAADVHNAILDLADHFADGTLGTNDAAAEAPLMAMWQSLAPSPFITDAAAEALRRDYDTAITAPYTGANMPTLTATVTRWRETHLSRATWDAGTFTYAIATARTWDEVASLWTLLGDKEYAKVTMPENIRARTAIVDRIIDGPDAPDELREAAGEFNRGRQWLLTRMRMAETMADLKIVTDLIAATYRGAEHDLTLMRCAARKFDLIAATATAPDPDTTPNGWAPADILRATITQWRTETYDTALAATTAAGGRDLAEADRYTILDCALMDARHTGERGHVAALLDAIARLEGHEHLLTTDHITKLRAAAGAGERIDLNGETD
jgi:hypothetical protein